jgi:two-component system cell cycle sensor histidine kinase/response regulator CckA
MPVVLVVDDEEPIRRLVCAAAASAGCQYLEASNGLEAVALFRSNRDRIDLVITDISMPVMDGHEAVVRIRESKAAVPIICMSGYVERPMPPGVNAVRKPFAIPALSRLIRELLQPSAA